MTLVGLRLLGGCHRCAAAKDVMRKLVAMEKIFIYILEVLEALEALEVLEVLEKGRFQTRQNVQQIQ